MMIALPNQDKSFTVTLFMPFSQFSAINSKHKLLHFFRRNFPDAVPLIGEEDLVSDFFASQPSHLISIKVTLVNILTYLWSKIRVLLF